MDWALVVIWLTAAGSLQPDPWQDYPSKGACEAAKESAQTQATDKRMLFMTGCVHKPNLHRYRAFDMDLEPGKERDNSL